MKQPFVSICIAASKAERFLEATLRSVQAQTFQDWEVIVVEDGSRDRTEALVNEFSLEVSQSVSYLRHTYNRGVPATRNTAVAAAAGEWVAFLDADNLWKPAHLAALISTTQIEDCDAVFSGSTRYDNATWTRLGTCIPSDADLSSLALSLFTGRLTILPSAVMIRRTALARFGSFTPEFPHCHDTEYWLRLLQRQGRLLFSGENTCIFRNYDETLSRNLAEILIESARVCERYADWHEIPRPVARQRIADLYRWAGHTLLPEGRDAALPPLAKAIRSQPLNPKNLGLWATAFFRAGGRRSAPPFPGTPLAGTPSGR